MKSTPSSACWDHPRLRGKDRTNTMFVRVLLGSPPLARERLQGFPYIPTRIRITPACAGKTFFTCIIQIFCKDHPRLRGKDPVNSSTMTISPGSPPLARERRIFIDNIRSWPGITPACAGKTSHDTYSYGYRWDHPRLRGKDVPTGQRPHCRQGSPPLARERLGFINMNCTKHRITPACAGKTSSKPHGKK